MRLALRAYVLFLGQCWASSTFYKLKLPSMDISYQRNSTDFLEIYGLSFSSY